MNKRIEELADRCWQHTGKGFLPLPKDSRLSYADSYEFDYEKFARLLVQDCIKLNSQALSISAIERLLPLYKEHFGVGE